MSTSTTASVVRWGIIGTGGISTLFAQDLLVDPSTRGVSDVSHRITAVGSRSVDSARRFIDKLRSASTSDERWAWGWGVANGKLAAEAYGMQEQVYDDPNVDVIYVGTPPSAHYALVKGALLAGKPVLMEKPFTFDLKEAQELVRLARENKVFLMEAVWTRFHPIAIQVEKVLQSGVLGRPRRFTADFSMDLKPDSLDTDHWTLRPEDGGGSLLDQGPYPSVWAMLLVHRNPHTSDADPQVIFSHQTVYERTGVDLDSRWLVEWGTGTATEAVKGMLTTDMNNAGYQGATAVLQCEEGDLVVEYPPYKPETFHVVPRPPRFAGSIKDRTTYSCPIAEGNYGLCYEADEVGRCLRDGKTESDRMPLDESLVVQGWFEVVRTSGKTALRGLKGVAGETR